METKRQLIPEHGHLFVVTADNEPGPTDTRTFVTRDHEVIKRWAARVRCEPATGVATGVATASGPATIDVQDGGSALRFNFAGMGLFRPIDWAEWLEHFDSHELVFVYEGSTPDGPTSARYRLVKAEDLKNDLQGQLL